MVALPGVVVGLVIVERSDASRIPSVILARHRNDALVKECLYGKGFRPFGCYGGFNFAPSGQNNKTTDTRRPDVG